MQELSTIDSYIGNLPFNEQQEYIDFVDIAEINFELMQLPDSLQDSLITINQIFLQNIANMEFHIAQMDAQALLEQKDGILYDKLVYLPDSSTAKSSIIIINTDTDQDYVWEETDNEIKLNVYPNLVGADLQSVPPHIQITTPFYFQ